MPAPATTPTAISANASPSRRCAESSSLVRPTVRAVAPTPLASRFQPPRRPRKTALLTEFLLVVRRTGALRVAGERVEERAVDLAGGRFRALLPEPPPEPRPLDLEEAVRFAIPHTVVGSRH